MRENPLQLNIIMKISVILFPIPIFLGGYLEERFGVKSLVYLIVILSPFYINGMKNAVLGFRRLLQLRYIVFLTIYLIYGLITLYFSLDAKDGVSILIMLVLPIFLGIMFSGFNLIEIYKYFSWSGLFYITLLYLGLPNVIFDYQTISSRFGHYYGDIIMNPNSLSIYIICVVVYFLYKVFISKELSKLIMNLFPLILIMYYLLLTQSRSGLFTIVIIVVLTLFLKRTFLSITLNVFVTAAIFITILFGMNIELQSRLMEADLNSRDEIWEVALNAITENKINLLLGFGVGSSDVIIGKDYAGFTIVNEEGVAKANAHNMYLENLLNVGVIGLLFFMLFFIFLLCSLYRNFVFQKTYLPAIVPIIFLVSGVMGNHMRTYFFIFVFSIVIAYAIQEVKENMKSEKAEHLICTLLNRTN